MHVSGTSSHMLEHWNILMIPWHGCAKKWMLYTSEKLFFTPRLFNLSSPWKYVRPSNIYISQSSVLRQSILLSSFVWSSGICSQTWSVFLLVLVTRTSKHGRSDELVLSILHGFYQFCFCSQLSCTVQYVTLALVASCFLLFVSPLDLDNPPSFRTKDGRECPSTRLNIHVIQVVWIPYFIVATDQIASFP